MLRLGSSGEHDRRPRGRQAVRARLGRQIRDRIISGIHAGRYEPGDRLPTYRELGEQLGANLRVVQSIYRELADEGLVEVRGRSGVFVAAQERIGGVVLAETARWMVDVLADARQRQITLPDFPDFVRRCIAYGTLDCLCVESTEDQRQALCHELGGDYGLRTRPFAIAATGIADGRALREQAAGVDIIVTTTYHAPEVRALAGELEKPFVVVRLRREMIQELRRSMRGGVLTIVYVDPLFVDRVTLLFDEHVDVRAIPVDDRGAIARLDPTEPVLISTAARRMLHDMHLPPPFSPGPMISEDSTRALIELIVRLNLESMREERGMAAG